MTNQGKLECCIAVLSFLEDDYDVQKNQNFYSPKMEMMENCLNEHYGSNSMVNFTEYINANLSMGYIIKDLEGYKNFFTNHSRKFFKEAISKLREIKIEEILNI